MGSVHLFVYFAGQTVFAKGRPSGEERPARGSQRDPKTLESSYDLRAVGPSEPGCLVDQSV